MSRRDDLEQHIRESYELVREYEDIVRTTDRPEERQRAERVIRKQRSLIGVYLGEYQGLLEQLRQDMPQDIAEITVSQQAVRKEGHAGRPRSDVREKASKELKTESPPQPEQDGPVRALVDWLLDRWLWLYYGLVLLVAVLGFVSNMGQVFHLTLCTQHVLFAALAFVGGILSVGFSFMPHVRDRYENWDRLVTAGICIGVTIVLGVLAYRSCTASGNDVYADYQVRVETELAQVIQNAKVTLEIEGRVPRNEFTDANGIARFAVESSDAGKRARLVVEPQDHDRYRSYTENVDLILGELPYVVQLESLEQTPSPAAVSVIPRPKPMLTPTDTLAPVLTLTLTPIPVESIPMDLIREGCKAGKFEESGGSLLLTECDISQHHNAIKLSWDVSRGESFAGCAIYLPIESALAATNNTHLILWIQGGQENKLFRIGLGSTDGIEKKEIVSVATEGQVAIPLAEFSKAGVGLEHINRLIIAFEYYLGEESRRGEVCIDEVGFGTP